MKYVAPDNIFLPLYNPLNTFEAYDMHGVQNTGHVKEREKKSES